VSYLVSLIPLKVYTLSEAWSGVNWADLMAAQGVSGTDFYDRSILRPKHRAYHRSGRPVIKIGPKGALGSHEIPSIHSAPSLGQCIPSEELVIVGAAVVFGMENPGNADLALWPRSQQKEVLRVFFDAPPTNIFKTPLNLIEIKNLKRCYSI